MHTASFRHLLSRVLARTSSVLARTSSVLLLSFSATVATPAGAESAPPVPTTQSTQASPDARSLPASQPAGRAIDAFRAGGLGEQTHVDQCFESTLSHSANTANTAYCDAVINALSGRLLDADQSWELAAALNNRALGRSRTKDLEGAISDLTAAIDNLPQWAELYVNRGNLYLKAAAHAAALADYDRALQLSGGRLDAVLFNRAFVQRALGQPKRAEEELLRWQATLWQETAAPVVPDATEQTPEPLSGG